MHSEICPVCKGSGNKIEAVATVKVWLFPAIDLVKIAIH